MDMTWFGTKEGPRVANEEPMSWGTRETSASESGTESPGRTSPSSQQQSPGSSKGDLHAGSSPASRTTAATEPAPTGEARKSATLRHLAHLLLDMPNASGQLAEVMVAVRAVREGGVAPPLAPGSPASQAQQGEEGSQAATLSRLANLLLDIPSLSGELTAEMEAILAARRGCATVTTADSPPAKRCKLSASAPFAAHGGSPASEAPQASLFPADFAPIQAVPASQQNARYGSLEQPPTPRLQPPTGLCLPFTSNGAWGSPVAAAWVPSSPSVPMLQASAACASARADLRRSGSMASHAVLMQAFAAGVRAKRVLQGRRQEAAQALCRSCEREGQQTSPMPGRLGQ